MNKGGAKAPPFIMRGSLEVSTLFYGEEAKVPRFLRGSGDGNAERGVIFVSKFGNIYQKIHIERRKNYALC